MTTSCETMRPEIVFYNQVSLVPDSSYRFRLGQNLHVRINDKEVVIGKGFRTDLASVPRIFWVFYSPIKYESIRPAVVHDYLYAYGTRQYTRKEIDEIFYWMLRDNGLSKMAALAYWASVRCFGWLPYKANRHFNNTKD